MSKLDFEQFEASSNSKNTDVSDVFPMGHSDNLRGTLNGENETNVNAAIICLHIKQKVMV